ncbi:caspase family protein [Phormidium sp. LEGE 05292]|uniref:caspase family protein n=1 Tax=[Phormidium] sp. LEGE 05292 TaxID=767427 RepID=UPI00187FA1E0|nr:caspase family protein [Phormidium sp. LEGE 05292]MBE9225072.1 caspase family protein [Phormidium sp. LEGE 05292]
MTKNIYALLVAIDSYHPASVPIIPPLKGCVNDIEAVEAYLQERTKGGEWKLAESNNVPWILKNEQATRQAIINSFQQHLCNANSDDVIFFYYSGHGAQEKAVEEFWHLEPDRLNETLVCYDSRVEDGRDLADKELAYLISQVAQNNPHVVIILDCCHSGSGTRDLSTEVTVRRAPVDSRERPLSSYIFAQDKIALDKLLTSSSNLEKKTTGIVLPQGRHVMLSACRDYELAKEYKAQDGQPRGAFSYFLLETLQRTNGSLTYQDLARTINALVSGKVQDQSPQVEATDSEELNQPFLGGAITERPFYFTLTYSSKDKSWAIDGGALHGIPKSSGDILLAIYPLESTAEQLREPGEAVLPARVTQVLPQRSKVEIIEGSDRKLSENESYWAVVTSLPIEPLKVYFQGEQTGVELAHQALLTAQENEKPSLYVRRVDESADADYKLLARDGQYWLTLPTDNRPLVAPLPEKPDRASYTPERALQIIQRLEHIARWTNTLELESPATTRIKPEDLKMEIVHYTSVASSSSGDNSKTTATQASDMRLEYEYHDGTWTPPTFYVRLTNNSKKTLYCNILDLTESFAVFVPFFPDTTSVRLQPGETIEGAYIDSVVPDELWEQGITERKDRLKLIVSTTEFNASLLEQDALDLPRSTQPQRSLEVDELQYQGTLNSLMSRVQSREMVASSKGNTDDWMTKIVTIETLRPQAAGTIGQHDSTRLLGGAVEVQPHPSLQAKVSLTTEPQASRDLGNLILPPILRQEPHITQAFQFTTSRGSDPGLSALELFDVEDYTVVTPETPLTVLFDTALEENEYLLPLGYDGEFFLPLGRGLKTENGKTEIKLERLPRPTVSSRSLQGSIRIFLEKVVKETLGGSFEYPILASAKVRDDGTVIYEKDPEKVKELVARSQRIVLYIHGIIGDTESMVPSIRQARIEVDGQQHSIEELYDVVLTFDYENIKTTIEENARLLGKRLAEVGLGANHGKELHVVAHSMGGLVSRWFIEQEGGNRVVQHLVMLGTPNGGSPWPTVQDWIFMALGIGLNQLSFTVWPTKVVALLLGFLEANDYSLEQMQPNSPFLRAIAENPDPQVFYTIIAGDRSILPAAMQVESQLQSSPLQRLMQKLFNKAVDKVVDLAFFQQPNDIAVSLKSIKKVSDNRIPPPKILVPDTACDHLTYFTSKAGLEALALALSSNSPASNR